MQKANMDVRTKAKEAGIPLWRIGVELGVNEATVVRRLRLELPEERKQEILQIIATLAARENA